MIYQRISACLSIFMTRFINNYRYDVWMKSEYRQYLPHDLGRKAEEAVRFALSHRGFREVARNYSVPRIGELDLVFMREDSLYIIEVRLRKSGGNFGTPADSVRPIKRNRIYAAARIFIEKNGLSRYDIVFWAACVCYGKMNERFSIKIVPF